MVTIRDIARELGVATSTVSYALNNDHRIPEATKHKVLLKAKELNYQGKSGKKNDDNYLRQVVICVNSINGDTYSEIITAIKKVLNINNCDLLIYVGKVAHNLKWLDGLLVFNSQLTTESIEMVVDRHIPVVIMDRKEDIYNTISVTLDNYNGAYLVTQALIRRGAKKFIFVGGPTTSFESKERYAGFTQALTDNLISHKDLPTLQSDFTYNGGKNVSKYILQLPTLPDAIVCANDEMAMGIIDQFANIDEQLLSKISFGGFDGSKPTRDIYYATAKADREHWGSMAAYSILQKLSNTRQNDNIVLPAELIEYN